METDETRPPEPALAPEPAPASDQVPEDLATVVVVDGSGRRTFVAAPGGRIFVGSDASATIRLTDPRVSFRYAVIERSGPGWLVTSLDPANPIWILDETGRPRPVLEELGLRSGTLLAGATQLLLFPPAASKVWTQAS
jgi:hypothetical protein